MKKKIILSATVVLAMATALSACKSSDSDSGKETPFPTVEVVQPIEEASDLRTASPEVYDILEFITTETLDGEATITEYSYERGEDRYRNKIIVPSGLNGVPITAIGDDVFNGAVEIFDITIPETIKSIGTGAFYGCTNIKELKLPESVTEIKDSTFGNCAGLVEINIPKNVTVIDDNAFWRCFELKNITIPDGVTKIGAYAFSHCTALENLVIPPSVTEIGAYAFNFTPWFEQLTEEFVIINNILIDYNGSEANVVVPEGVVAISSAFSDNAAIKTVTLPKSLTKIGHSSFFRCSNLESIVVPASVTVIENHAFYSCSSLQSIQYLGDAPEIAEDAFKDVPEGLIY